MGKSEILFLLRCFELAPRAASVMPPLEVGENAPSLISLQKEGPFSEDDKEPHL